MVHIFQLEPFEEPMEGILNTSVKTPLKFQNKDHTHVQSICIWQGYVVTLAKDIKLWNAKGEFIAHTNYQAGHISSSVAWDEYLIICEVSKVTYWTMNQKNNQVTIELVREFVAHIDSDHVSAVVWKNALVTLGLQDEVKFWDKNGNMIHQATMQAYRLFVIQGYLWTYNHEYAIQKWEQIEEGLWQPCLTIVAHEEEDRVLSICGWGNTRIASSSHDGIVKVWTLDGQCLFTFPPTKDVDWSSVIEWLDGRLAVVTDLGIVAYNWDGSICMTVSCKISMRDMLVHQDILWLADRDRTRMIWNPRMWKIERVLWIGFMKNNPSECLLASIPKEILKHIIEFLA